MLSEDQRHQIESMISGYSRIIREPRMGGGNENASLGPKGDALEYALKEIDRLAALEKSIAESAQMCGFTPDVDPCKTVRGMALVLIDRQLRDKDRRIIETMKQPAPKEKS